MTERELEETIPMIPNYRVVSKVQILSETMDYNHEMMNIPAMWKKTRGEGVKVVVLDTGLPKHIDLNPQAGKSFLGDYLVDLNGHSSHVGGIIAAISNNGMGVAGIAPDCEDYYGAVLGKSGAGSISAIIRGIRWAVDDIGAQIINMSLGIAAGNVHIGELEKACDYARSQGVAVICASGNEYSDVGQPACYDSTIAVAAVNDRRKYARFSNSGPEVTFAAGGVDVYSTFLKNGYARLSGTSMACPALTGVAALILADHHKDNDKWLTPDELIEKIKKIAFDVGDEGFDETYGHGIPIFRGDGEIENPKKEKDEGGFGCTLGLPIAKQFTDAAVASLSSSNSLGDSLKAGLVSVGNFLNKIEDRANRRR